jgi:hypothetical protein
MLSDTALPISLFEEPPPVGEIVVRPIDHGTARKSVMRYHYSRRMPMGNLRCWGAWEDDTRYVGAVIFGDGATPEIGKPYGLEQSQMVELVRVAFTDHEVPVTQIIAVAIRELKASEPPLRLIVSYADERQGHLGKVYQAGNWLYAGTSDKFAYFVNGEEVQPRTLHHRYGTGGQSIPWLRENVDPNASMVPLPPKHRYLYPLDKAMRRQILKIALPYPRGLSVSGDTSSFQVEETSSILVDRSCASVEV